MRKSEYTFDASLDHKLLRIVEPLQGRRVARTSHQQKRVRKTEPLLRMEEKHAVENESTDQQLPVVSTPRYPQEEELKAASKANSDRVAVCEVAIDCPNN